jgi:hypothetical protein
MSDFLLKRITPAVIRRLILQTIAGAGGQTNGLTIDLTYTKDSRAASTSQGVFMSVIWGRNGIVHEKWEKTL